MGTSGVPFNPKKDYVIEVIYRYNGVLSHCCAAINCRYETLKKYIDKHEDLIALLDEVRHARCEYMLDSAEDVLVQSMENFEEDAKNAIRAAFFVLNNKGKERGYTMQKSLEQIQRDIGYLHDLTSIQVKDECVNLIEDASEEHQGSQCEI